MKPMHHEEGGDFMVETERMYSQAAVGLWAEQRAWHIGKTASIGKQVGNLLG